MAGNASDVWLNILFMADRIYSYLGDWLVASLKVGWFTFDGWTRSMVVASPNLASGHAMQLGVEINEAYRPLELSLKSLVRCGYYLKPRGVYCSFQYRKWLRLLHWCIKIKNSMVCNLKDIQGSGPPAIWKE